MTLKERLASDFKEAMKSKDGSKKNTISFARAAIKQYEVDNRKEADDPVIIDILTKQVKMRKDALSDFEKGGRTDLIEDYNKEIEVLMEYLPKQLTEDEIKAIVTDTIDELGIEPEKKNMGRIMGAVMPKVKGKADGNAVKTIIQNGLS